MISWSDFKAQQPELARQGADLLYHYGVGLAFLGTVRADGGPRLHPMCPLLTETGLYAFIVPSPKQRDLHRDGRYVMHSFPLDDNEDAFYLSGVVSHVSHPQIRDRLARQFADERSDVAHHRQARSSTCSSSRSRWRCSPGPPAMAIPHRNTPSGGRPRGHSSGGATWT